jgi:transcription termination/antitermination factor NusG
LLPRTGSATQFFFLLFGSFLFGIDSGYSNDPTGVVNTNRYSLRVIVGKENKVKDTIFRELDFEKDLKTNVEEILIPTENIVDIKNGKKTVKEKSLLPGYILVKMAMNNEIKFFIENVDGVMSFVGPKGSPQPVTEAEMSRYLVSAESDEFSSEEIDEIPFKVGDSVKVIDGPFKEFNGLVQEVNDRNRIKVNVNIFGRPTPIELSVNQILSES